MYDFWEEVSVSGTKCTRVRNEEGRTVLLVFKAQDVDRLVAVKKIKF